MEINVLGLGESLKEFKPNENITIGVNDINKYHEVDYIVCVDRPTAFTTERLTPMINSFAQFFTHLSDWEKLRDVNLMRLAHGRGVVDNIDGDSFCYSNNSTYVAVVLAYKLGATTINIFGVDFNTHKNFKGSMLNATLRDFKILFDCLKSKGIEINVTKSSALNQII